MHPILQFYVYEVKDCWILNTNELWTITVEAELKWAKKPTESVTQQAAIATIACGNKGRLRHQTIHMQIFSNIKVSSNQKYTILLHSPSFLIISNIIFMQRKIAQIALKWEEPDLPILLLGWALLCLIGLGLTGPYWELHCICWLTDWLTDSLTN